VSAGDLVGDVEDLGCGLGLEQFDRIAKMLQAVFSELLGLTLPYRLCVGSAAAYKPWVRSDS
jgi:hypothetical protein